jgi:tetratricopeptide (TPR) repeat protein
MKAEHRHHLKANVVAESLGRAYESIKQGPSRLGWILISVVGLIIVLVLAWRYYSRSGEEGTSTQWTRWDALNTPNQVKQFADSKENVNTPPGRVARFQQARMDLHAGLAELGSDSKSARERLQQAANAYADLAGQHGLLSLQVYEALRGAAQAYEGLFENDKAQENYQKIVEKFPDTPLAADAQAQIDRLKKAAESKDLDKLNTELNPSEKSAGSP